MCGVFLPVWIFLIRPGLQVRLESLFNGFGLMTTNIIKLFQRAVEFHGSYGLCHIMHAEDVSSLAE